MIFSLPLSLSLSLFLSFLLLLVLVWHIQTVMGKQFFYSDACGHCSFHNSDTLIDGIGLLHIASYHNLSVAPGPCPTYVYLPSDVADADDAPEGRQRAKSCVPPPPLPPSTPVGQSDLPARVVASWGTER